MARLRGAGRAAQGLKALSAPVDDQGFAVEQIGQAVARDGGGACFVVALPARA